MSVWGEKKKEKLDQTLFFFKALYAESSTAQFKMFSAGTFPPSQAFVHNTITLRHFHTDGLSGKYPVTSWEIYHSPNLEISNMLISVLDVLEYKEIQSKLIVIKSRACIKQATQTRDGSQSFHNLSTKVSSVTCVYVQRQWMCVSVFVSVAFFLHVCHSKCK